MKKLLFTLILLLISACSTIGSQVEGWPKLNTTVHNSSLIEINQKCWKYLSTFEKLLGTVSFGCAIYNLDKNTCDIYVLPNSSEFIIEHELAHCEGRDHHDGNLDAAYRHWLDANSKISAHYGREPPVRLVAQNGTQYWDRSSKFGVIPPELFVLGQQQCAAIKTDDGQGYQAIGYHPLAQDSSGETFVGGGYFCTPKLTYSLSTIGR